jgi:hypothetical protein
MVALSIACSSSSPNSGGTLNQQGASSSGGSGDDGSAGASGSGSGAGASSSGTTSSSGTGSSGAQSSSSGTSGGGSGSSGSSSSSGSSGSDASTSYGPYPSGPYCQPAGSLGHLSAGCVLPNTTWIGYADPKADAVATTKPFANYSLDDARKSGHRWAMINVAEFQCPGCAHSGTELEAMGAAVEKAGGVVIEVLETDGFQNCATQPDLMTWITRYSLEVTTVIDPGGLNTPPSPSPSLAFFGLRDQAYIVDLTTMKVTQYIAGSIAPVATNSAGLALQALDSLLLGDGGGGG